MSKVFLTCLLVNISMQLYCQTFTKDLSIAMSLQTKGEYKEGTAKFKPYFKNNTKEFPAALKPYCADTSEKVRTLACSLLSAFVKSTVDLSVRSASADLLIRLVSDKNASVRFNAIRTLHAFSTFEISEPQKNNLSNAFKGKAYADLKPAIRLIGFLNLNELKDNLLFITNDPVLSVRQKWDAQLALARMGDTTALNYVLEKIKSVPLCDDLVYQFTPDLVYIRQYAAFAYLVEILNNDNASCTSSNPDASGKILCGYRVIEQIAPTIKDFPLKIRASGDIETKDYKEALNVTRKWFKEKNGNYTINKDNF